MNGLLVPAQDANALAGAMERFVVDSMLGTRMAARSRQLAEERFGSREVATATAEAMGL